MGTTRVNASETTTTTTTTRNNIGRVRVASASSARPNASCDDADDDKKATAATRRRGDGTNGFFRNAPSRLFSRNDDGCDNHATTTKATSVYAERRHEKVNGMQRQQQQQRRNGRGFYALGLIGTLALFLGAQTTVEARAADIFTNAFLVKMKNPADRAVADRVAARNGFVNLGSAANAISWPDTLKAVKENVEQVIDAAISKVEEEFVANQLKTITVAADLSEGTTKFGDKIWDLISSVTQNVTVEISELTSAVEGVNINECTKLSDRLGNVAKTAIASTSACINKKLTTGFDYIETINKVSNDVMVELTEIREKAQHCGEHIDGAKSAATAIFCAKEVLGSQTEYHFVHRALPHARSKRSVPHTRRLKIDPLVHTAVQQPGFKRVKRGYRPLSVDQLIPLYEAKNFGSQDPTDPYFQYQWYLKNTGQNGGKPKLDLNVEAAWAQGVTGKNVTTAIMDDGVDYMHPDLKYNYNARASYDFSSNDPYPYPRYTDDWFNSHGTRCAGEVAAARDNGVCGVGVAYDSKIAGIRMLDQPYMTDLIEANSMGHEPDLIDIYSASWGPTDDGKTVDGPRNATMRAIVRGVNEGRKGLGNIYVWASGDGGEEDDCNCDGYAASMWTVSINSAINDGQNAHYDESCSSTLASTFSNGAKDPNTGVATTDLYGKCTTTHSGTSAAAPEAAGVFALALEANPLLTWRDIQHLTVLTSKRNSLFDAKERFHWQMNGVGLEYNHLFGYGVLDAGAMVALAKQWKSVPPRYHCQAGSVIETHEVPSDGTIMLSIKTDACAGTEYAVNYLEHVQAVISVNASRRGDLELFLTSPMGTRSMILSRRPNDDDKRDGFTKWPFMTTHTWGEYPQGTWLLEARFDSPLKSKPQQGWLKEWTLMLHGTREPPYTGLPAADPHSKLAIVKKAHEERSSGI